MKLCQLLCLLFLLIAGLDANGQLHFGPEGGLNLCNLQGTSLNGAERKSEFENRVSYRIGLTADCRITEHIHLQPALFYAKKGCRFARPTFRQPETFFHDLVNIDYLELPIRLEYKAGPPTKDRFIAGAGVYIARALHGNSSIPDGLWGGQTTISSLKIGNAETDNFKPNDFGFSANVGFELRRGLFVRVYYNYGLTDIDPDSRYRAYISELGISTGYLIGMLYKAKK